MQVTVKLLRDGTLWRVYSDDLPGAITHGRSMDEALRRFGMAADALWNDAVKSGPDNIQKRKFEKVFSGEAA